MLLRESSKAIGEAADLTCTNGASDGALPNGSLLLRFAEAATRANDELDAARTELVSAVGAEAFVEAAATVGIFNGLVRVADGTGIPLDDGTRSASVAFRETLGLNTFGSAANTDLDAPAAEDVANHTVERLFS
jgi:hypothetical protein